MTNQKHIMKRKIYSTAEEKIKEADGNNDWIDGACKAVIFLALIYLIFG